MALVFADKIVDYRRLHPGLSAERDEFLQRVLAVLRSGRAFSYDPNRIARDEMLALVAEAERLFPDRVDRRALFVIVPAEDTSGAKEPTFINRMAAWLLMVVPSSTVEAMESEACGCNLGGDDCSEEEHCCDDNECTVSTWVVSGSCYPHGSCYEPPCGTLAQSPCNGVCQPTLID